MGVLSRVLGVSVGVLLGCLVCVCPVFASGAWWHLSWNVHPSVLQAGGEGTVVVHALNVGDHPSSGEVVVTAGVPVGMSVGKVEVNPGEPQPKVGFIEGSQVHVGTEEESRFHGAGFGPEESLAFFHACREPVVREVQCGYKGFFPSVHPYEYLELGVAVKVEVGFAAGEGFVEVSGGEAPVARVRRAFRVGGAVSFGVEEFAMVPEEEGGGVDVRAGSHPFQMTTSFALNQNTDALTPPGLVRDLQFQLPPGLVADVVAFPQCNELNFTTLHKGGIGDLCPEDTAVGVAMLTVDEPLHGGVQTTPVPVFNLKPRQGEPARFGFEFIGIAVTIDTAVRSGRDYGATASVSNTTEIANVLADTVTFWGVPGAQAHNESRGWGCIAHEVYDGGGSGFTCNPPSGVVNPPPFLTLPTSCATPFVASVSGSSWPTKASPDGLSLAGSEYHLQDEFARPLGLSDCNQLSFQPAIALTPDVSQASSATGPTVRVSVAQQASESSSGLAGSNVKGLTVTLAQGLTANAASADGLLACSEGQVGFEGTQAGVNWFSASLGAGFCSTASELATVQVKSPLLANPLEGGLYLATQNENPFGSLIAIYLVIEDPVSGVLVKQAGRISLDGQTGQITSMFENMPDLPFSEATLHFFTGPRAALSTPPHCGSYTTTALFSPSSGNAPVQSSSSFAITSGPEGAACPPTPLTFTPTISAGGGTGTTDPRAGAFTDLTTTISRPAGNQALQSVQLHYPPGISGILTGIPLCPEEQANTASCPAASLIGHSTASVGVGSEPYTVTGGEVFLTEGYKGAPFGLSIVTPAVAGPFNLGKVIVRAKLEINPTTAAVTVTTDALPHILDGIPLQIDQVNATIDRPNFTFNPTSCDPMSVTATITGLEETTTPASEPFAATNCALLKFSPKFTFTTNGKTSKTNGASLTTRITYPPNSLGAQANIAKVKVDLPKALPSRLTTLHHACLAAVFETNPALCSPLSIIGHAKVSTPLIPVPLQGPAYFVSHGNEAFPSLTIVLQGYGITITLVGSTLIHNGITSTTFHTTPDAPFNTFELTLPQGPDSALAANTNLCKTTLPIPTAIIAQNGQETHQTNKITTTNCPKPPKHTNTKHHTQQKHTQQKIASSML